MKTLLKLTLLLLIMHSCTNRTNIEYPETRKDTIADNYWGTVVPDPYRWLEDDRSAETEAWVVAQHQVTYSYLEKIPFRNKLKERFTELMNYPKYGSPKKVNNKYYFYKNDGLQNQSVLYELDSLTAEPKVLLDPNKLSIDGTIALSQAAFSKDGKYLAYVSLKAAPTGTKFT